MDLLSSPQQLPRQHRSRPRPHHSVRSRRGVETSLAWPSKRLVHVAVGSLLCPCPIFVAEPPILVHITSWQCMALMDGHKLVHRTISICAALHLMPGDEMLSPTNLLSSPSTAFPHYPHLLRCSWFSHKLRAHYTLSQNHDAKKDGPHYDTRYDTVDQCKGACSYNVKGCDAINYCTYV